VRQPADRLAGKASGPTQHIICQMLAKWRKINSFVKRKPDVKLAELERVSVKEAEVRLVVDTGVSFATVNNRGFRNFAQQMINIGAKHGNTDVDDVPYGQQTIRQSVFGKMRECHDLIKENVQASCRCSFILYRYNN